MKRDIEPKRQRVPLSSRDRFEVRGKNPDFEYRIFNDVGDRILRAKAAGFEICVDETVGAHRVDVGTGIGTTPEMPVGGGAKGYLMRIPKEHYDEDQKAKQDDLMQLETSILNPKIDGGYGKITNE